MHVAYAAVDTTWRRLKCQFWRRHILNVWRPCPVCMRTTNGIRSEYILFDLGGAGLRTELKHIIKCRKRNQMGFP